MKKINFAEQIKNLVAQFQEQTKSNSVLDFCTWVENKNIQVDILDEELRKMRNNHTQNV